MATESRRGGRVVVCPSGLVFDENFGVLFIAIPTEEVDVVDWRHLTHLIVGLGIYHDEWSAWRWSEDNNRDVPPPPPLQRTAMLSTIF